MKDLKLLNLNSFSFKSMTRLEEYQKNKRFWTEKEQKKKEKRQ